MSKFKQFVDLYVKMSGGDDKDWDYDVQHMRYIHYTGLSIPSGVVQHTDDLPDLVNKVMHKLMEAAAVTVKPKLVKMHQVEFTGAYAAPGGPPLEAQTVTAKHYWQPGKGFAVVPTKLTDDMRYEILAAHSTTDPDVLWARILDASPTLHGIDLEKYVGEYKKQIKELENIRSELLGTLNASHSDYKLLEVAWQEALYKQQALQTLVNKGNPPE